MTPIETLLQELDVKLKTIEDEGLTSEWCSGRASLARGIKGHFLPRLRAALASQPVTMTEEVGRLFALPDEFSQMPDGKYFGFYAGQSWTSSPEPKKYFDHRDCIYYQFAWGPINLPNPITRHRGAGKESP